MLWPHMCPDMPAPQITNDEECSNLVQCKGVIVSKALGLDLDFLKSIVTLSKIHENLGTGMVYVLVRSGGARQVTNTRYRLLIHLTSSDPSTIKTVTLEAQVLTASCGQPFVVETADQQLYRVIVANIWATPELCSNFFPRLSEIHTIMSFCGAFGKLVMDPGLLGSRKCCPARNTHKKSLLIHPTKTIHQSFVWIALCDQRFSSWHYHVNENLTGLCIHGPYGKWCHTYLQPHVLILPGMDCIICTRWKPFHQKSNTASYKISTLWGMQLVQQTQPGPTCSSKLPLWGMDTVRVVSQKLHRMTMLRSAGLSAFIPAVV